LLVIPIGATGFVSKTLWEKVINTFDSYFPNHAHLINDFKQLGDQNIENSIIIQTVIKIINNLNSK